MQKLALGIEYDGTLYRGWQKQKNVSSVQECIENALYKIVLSPIKVFCAGRTDAGVHAVGQVVHFTAYVKYPNSAWVFGVNNYLPSDICVHWVNIVNNRFHAQISAISRRYCYIIYNHCVRSAIFFNRVWHYYKGFLDVYQMSAAAQYLLGEHDFSSFRSSGCQSSSARRKIYHLHITRQGRYVLIDIMANSFLYHMVRNIVGSLVEVGRGKKKIIWILELLHHHNRSLFGITAPAIGLYLVEVRYPSCFAIPVGTVEKFWDYYKIISYNVNL